MDGVPVRLTPGAVDIIPVLHPAIEIAERYHPSAAPTIDAEYREQVREQLRSCPTTGQSYKRWGQDACWLTAIEEEARLENELVAYLASPEALRHADDCQLRWELIAARVFGDTRRVEEVCSLYRRGT